MRRLVALVVVVLAVPALAQVQPKPVVKKPAPAQQVDFNFNDKLMASVDEL